MVEAPTSRIVVICPSTVSRGTFATVFLVAALFAGCTVGPKYTRPTVQIPSTYKEAGTWKVAQPRAAVRKGKWWKIFNDPKLNSLEDQLSVSNLTLRVAEDRFLEARAALRFTRAGEFPFIGVGANASRQRQSSNRALRGASSPSDYWDFLLSGEVSYEADVWGRVRRTVEASRSEAQASAADMETVHLSLHSELAQDYFALRGLDAQKQLLDSTVSAYEKALELTETRFHGGLASREDVEQATTQLEQTRAQDIDIASARSRFEHAIAVLVGQPAPTFSLAPNPLKSQPPAIPIGVPSALLERRPDIAAAERRVEAENAQIGVARAAYFPLVLLSATAGFESGKFSSWLTGPSTLWSAGGSALQTAFDAGRRRAVSESARAAHDAAVASYRQTVLAAFQEVEDSLSDLTVLQEESKTQDAAVAAAQRSLNQAMNRYTGGLENYLTVLTAQSVALANQRTAVTLLTRQMTSSVLLVKALGGGWDVSQLPPVD